MKFVEQTDPSGESSGRP